MKPLTTHCLEEGELRLYMDGVLPGAEHTSITGHLAGCEGCRERMEALAALEMQVAALLPTPSSDFDAQAALERLRLAQDTQVRVSSLTQTRRSLPGMQYTPAQRRPDMKTGINRGPVRVGLAVAFVIALLVAGAVFLFNRPATVSAAEIVAKAEQAATTSTVQSFHGILYAKGRNSAGQKFMESTDERYYVAPNSHRSDAIISTSDGQESRLLWVTDGNKPWGYESSSNQVTLFDPDVANPTFGAESLSAKLKQLSSSFYNATVAGSEPVAGRMAYIIDMTLKPKEQWPANHVPSEAARLKVWVDQGAYFILRLDGWDADGNVLFNEWYKSFEINVPVDPALFSFAPPPGAKIVQR